MSVIESIYCPNCGHQAERSYGRDRNVVRVQCPTCDYLMVTCAFTARVIEAYAPGLYAHRL